MHLKRYTVISILLIGALGIYIYTLTESTYTLEMFEIPLTFPVALWVVLPLLVYYVASVMHMLFYGFRNYRLIRRYTKDIESLSDAIFWGILHAPKSHKYDIEPIRRIGKVLDAGCEGLNKVSATLCDEHVQKALETVRDIEAGNNVDLKKLGLDKENPIVVSNCLNLLAAEPLRSEEILRQPEKYSKEVVKKSLMIFSETANEQQVRKYADLYDLDIIVHWLHAMVGKTVYPVDVVKFLMEKLTLSEAGYVRIAKSMKPLYMPDTLISFFKEQSNQELEALPAYLYILAEFEMVDTMKEIVLESGKEEFLPYRAYLDLREAGKRYPIELFLECARENA